MKSLLKILLLTSIASTIIFSQQIRDISSIGPRTEYIDYSKYKNIYYIAGNIGSDTENDGSKGNPWKTISHGLNVVKIQSDSNMVAFFIGAGTYNGSTVIMKPNIDLFGGFSCKTWNRDIYKYGSILDGENKRRVVEGANNSRIDGFTIINGFSKTHGGGILCDDTSPIISNCFIVKNYIQEPENFNPTRIHQDGHHGAGIASFFNAVPIIRNNVFYGNQTSIGNGAGIAFYGWLRIKGAPETKIENNFMKGGLRPNVKNNVFIQNISGVNDTNSTRSSNGAAISCAFESRPIIENNVIASNQAKGRGDAGGIYSEYFSYPTIIGNWIVGNISDDDGGGIYVMKLGHASITNNFIAGNWTLGNGVGGIRISKEGRADIKENILVENKTGGAVDCVDGFMNLENNIVMHNLGRSSIRYSNRFSYFNSSIIQNNIIRENENEMLIQTYDGSDVIIQNNNIDEEKYQQGNFNKIVNNTKDKHKLKINDSKFDKNMYQTVIKVSSSSIKNGLPGRVVSINDFWSVIHRVDDNKIYIWGDATKHTPKNSQLQITSSYSSKNKSE